MVVYEHECTSGKNDTWFVDTNPVIYFLSLFLTSFYIFMWFFSEK